MMCQPALLLCTTAGQTPHTYPPSSLQTNYSELERQVAAVHRAQEARQQAAAAAAAAAAAQHAAGGPLLPPTPAEPVPMLMPLAALGSGEATTDEAGGWSEPPLPQPSARTMRRTRSLGPSPAAVAAAMAAASADGPLMMQAAASLPLPAMASASSGGSRQRRSPAIRPCIHPSIRGPATRQGRAGPGKGPRGAGKQQAQRRRQVGKPGAGVSGGDSPLPQEQQQQPPDLSPFGEGYQQRGPSAATPPKACLLTIEDFRPALKGSLVQVGRRDGCVVQLWTTAPALQLLLLCCYSKHVAQQASACLALPCLAWPCPAMPACRPFGQMAATGGRQW